MISETEAASILAGRYIDGTWSYTQILEMLKEYGVSKSALDMAIIHWRKALGEENFIQYDIQKGVELAT